MKKSVVLTLKVVVGLLAAIVLLLGISFAAFHTSAVQDRLVQKATELLSDYLQTTVHIEKASVSIIDQGVRLYGVEIDDRQQRKMFQMRELGVDLKLLPLLHKEVNISQAKIRGLEARLYKPASDSDSVANYQFVIDAFKSKKQPQVDSVAVDTTQAKKPMVIDVKKLALEDIKVSYNDTTHAELSSLRYKKSKKNLQTVELRELTTAFVQHTKKGDVDVRIRLGLLDAVDDAGRRMLTIDDLCYHTDNHKLRKNANKPKRGAFDVGHFDVIAHMLVSLDSIGKDTLVATISDGKILDRNSGLNINDLQLKVNANKRTAHLGDVVIKLAHTTLNIASADIQLPSKKERRPLSYSAPQIRGRVLLKDIARPFAPVLSKFSIPLNLQTQMSGNDNEMRFRNVVVNTSDRKLNIAASGRISNLKNKYALRVHFDVQKMTTDGAYAEHVINQFPVKKFMMKQLHALGNITYHGHFDVLWKKEQFAGLLHTALGQLNFQFALDELNKYVFGTVRTDSFELGKAMDMPDLGKIACKADFKFDISKPRTAKMRALKGGKLPIGSVNAEVTEGKYKKVKVRNLFAELESDAAVATGNITVKGKRMDVLCGFSFTNTNEMKKTKIKPGIKFHKMSDEDKAARDERRAAKKEAKQQAREERRAARAEQKAERKALRAEQKAEREAARAEKKALKAEEKALKAEEKAARKAAKAEAKAARKAAKAAAKAAEAAEE
ncbi:MAG: AsmA family protein [Prevotella sp.]|nr:AsmA family protein [Prevotella sp.]